MIGLKYYRRVEYERIDNISLTMDLYIPESEKALPVIVWFHEGGMVDRKGYAFGPPMMELVTRGYAIVQATYRVAGDMKLCSDPIDVQWPVMLQDAKTVIRYLRYKADEYGIDPERIGVAGDSAGGQLSAMMAVTQGNPLFESELYSNYSDKICCAVDFYGPSEFLTMDEHANMSPVKNPLLIHDSPESPESRCIGGPIQENQEKAKAASTVTYVSKDGNKEVPLLIFHGDHDPNVPFQQSVVLYNKMRECGYDVEFYPQAGHGHNLNFFEDIKDIVFAFFDKHVKGN